MDNAPSGSYSEFDSHHDASSQQAQAHSQRDSSYQHPTQTVRSLSNTIGIGRSQSYRENLPFSTTFAQLRVATVRGGISASEEQVEIARAQREKNAIHYHAGEAVKAGNDAAAVNREDLGYYIDNGSGSSIMNTAPPPLVSSGSNSSSSKSAVLENVTSDRNGSDKVAKSRIPWDAMQSVSSTFSARRSRKNPDGEKDSILEEKVLQMKQTVLRESHNQSGALLDSSIMRQPDLKARARVKLIIEHPDQAGAYIRMGLQNDPDMDISQMIRMIDYYCT